MNPLVLGSNPSGPTTFSSVKLRAAMRIECNGELQDYDAMTVRLRKPSPRHPGWLGALLLGARSAGRRRLASTLAAPRDDSGRHTDEHPG